MKKLLLLFTVLIFSCGKLHKVRITFCDEKQPVEINVYGNYGDLCKIEKDRNGMPYYGNKNNVCKVEIIN